MMALINGQPCDHVGLDERALQYGDGLFETIRIAHGQPRFWARHIARLTLGCERLSMPRPDPGLLHAELMQLLGQHQHGVVKLLLSRGAGGRGYRADAGLQPTRMLSFHGLPDYPASYARDGVVVRLCTTRLAHQPLLAGIKHLNRLEQVLARAEWQQHGIFEGLMRDYQENVVEGTMTNLLLRSGSQLVTPAMDQCGVAGVMRAEILDQAPALGYQVTVRQVRLNDLIEADELWLCNSILGIMPVRELLDVRQYAVSGRHRQFMV